MNKKLKFLLLLVGSISLGILSMDALDISDAVPAVSCIDQDGEDIAVADYCAKGYALVFFYPRAETSGCIKQVCSLRDHYEALSEKGIKILGVSVDGVDKQKHFHSNRKLQYPLLADEAAVVITAFGVPRKSSGSAMRQAYLFKDGKLVWKDEHASTAEQAADVFAAIADLESAS